MKYCLGNNDKGGKSVCIQMQFSSRIFNMVAPRDWRTGDNKKRDVFAFLQVLSVGLNGKEFSSHPSLSSICCSCFG